MADRNLLAGRQGCFALLDFRTHRLPRVVRSSYAAESFGLEEGVDAADVLRGQVAELLGASHSSSREWRRALEDVPLVGVVDARDSHDRVRSDIAATAGAQKSLGFCIASLRQTFRTEKAQLRWTHRKYVDGRNDEDNGHSAPSSNSFWWTVVDSVRTCPHEAVFSVVAPSSCSAGAHASS